MTNWINKGCPAIFNGEAIVSFLDILGFSQRVLNNWNDKADSPLEQLMRFKNNLPITERQPENEIEINGEVGFRYICRVSTYSDSIIVSHGFEQAIMYGDAILGTSSVLGNVMQIWRNAIVEGFTIRGAIELGDVYWDSDELVGPAFIKTYELESKFAKSSRVILGSNLVKMIREVLSHAESLRDPLLKYLLRDGDGYIILNPAALANSSDKTMLNNLIAMRDKCTDYFQREKYRNLIHYLSNDESKKGLSFECLQEYKI